MNTRIIIHFKRRQYSCNIYEYSRHLKVLTNEMVGKSLGTLFQYFGEETVKVESAYIDETNGTDSFISLHL